MTQLWQKRQQFMQGVVGLGAAALLILLARTLPVVTFRAGLPVEVVQESAIDIAPLPGMDPRLWYAFLILFWGSFVLSLLFLLFSRDGRKELTGSLRGIGVQLVFIFLILLFIYFFSMGAERELPAEEGEPVPATIIELPEVIVEEAGEEVMLEVQPPHWLTLLFSTLFLLGVGLGLYHWWQHRRTNRSERSLTLAELSRRAELAIAELRQGQRLDDVILRCYREMAETVSAQRGVRRGQDVTPREFERELLRAELPPQAVQRLTRLFELVRYGGYQPGTRDQLEAIDSLTAIIAACAVLAAREQASAAGSFAGKETAVSRRDIFLS
jgi:hypothetical protein